MHLDYTNVARHPRSAHGRPSSSLSTRQQEQVAPAPTENLIHDEASSVCSGNQQSCGSVDATPSITNLDPEYLIELKRRSLPYRPPRSSSLTLPPDTLRDGSPIASPIVTTRYYGRSSNEALPARRGSWGEWWRGLCAERRLLSMPTPKYMLSSDDDNHNMLMDDGDDVVSLEDAMSSDMSEFFDGPTVLVEKTSRTRRFNPLSCLWALGQYSAWRPAVNLLFFGYRPGVRFTKPLPLQDEVEEDINMEDEIDSTGSRSDDGQPAFQPKNNVPSTNLGNWRVLPAIEDAGPDAPNHRHMLEHIGNPPSSPRPAHRLLPMASNTLRSAQRLNETTCKSRTREFTEAALHMSRDFQRRSLPSQIAGPMTPMPDQNGNGGNKSTNSATRTVGKESIVGEGNLTIPEAMGSLTRGSAATATSGQAHT